MKSTTKSALDKIKDHETTNAIYQKLLERLKPVGRFGVEPKASSLHIVHGRAFLGVHYRKDGLLLNIVLDRPLETARLKDCQQVSRSRYHNEVLVTSPAEIDRELIGWVKEAHGLTSE